VKAIVVGGKQLLASQLKQILGSTGNGWGVVWSESAAKAEAELDAESMVVLDCDEDSGRAALSLKSVQGLQGFHDVPVLLVGSRTSESAMKGLLREGASGYVLRPLEEASVRSKVRDLTRPVGGACRLDVKLVNPFISAATEVMKTVTGIEIVRKDLFLKKNYRMFGDVSGVMGLSGEATGSVVISMPARLACLLVGRMLGEEPRAEVTDDVRDGIGEIVNMIAGRAKAILAGTEYHFTLSLPAVITGTGHEIAHRSGAPCIAVVFSAGEDEFALQISLSPEE
jgi:chemotaxis protein CheX